MADLPTNYSDGGAGHTAAHNGTNARVNTIVDPKKSGTNNVTATTTAERTGGTLQAHCRNGEAWVRLAAITFASTDGGDHTFGTYAPIAPPPGDLQDVDVLVQVNNGGTFSSCRITVAANGTLSHSGYKGGVIVGTLIYPVKVD